MSSAALESLTQRGESPLFKDLIKLHENVQHWTSDYSTSDLVTSTFSKHQYSKKLIAIVKRHMGVTLDNVTVYKDPEPNARMVVKDTPASAKERRHRQVTPGMQMALIQKLYNDKKAYLQPSADELPMTFNLWVSSGWWLASTQPAFTPREISAVILHELGHVDHFIKSLWRIYGRLTDSADLVSYLQANHDKSVILSTLAAIKKSPFLHPAWNSILSTTQRYFETTNSFDDPQYWEALTTLSTLVAAESSQRTLNVIGSIMGPKRDQISTHLHQLDPERQPDEFAARNGAYVDSISALTKHQQLREQMISHSLFPPFFHSTLGYFYHLFNLPAESIAFGYDPIMRRMELFLETAKHAFHDEQLPAEAKQEITHQINQAEQIIADYHSASHRAIRAKIKTWMDNISTFGRIFTSPFQDRLTDDYGRLQEASRSVSRHSLFFLASK